MVMCEEELELCPGWSPSSYINVAPSGTVEVDEAFADSLADDPSDLGRCDGGRIVPQGSVFEVQRTQPGEFLYELGLRDGDVIVGVNGKPLSSYAEVAVAFGDLYLGGSTTFRLEILRGGSSMFIVIELV